MWIESDNIKSRFWRTVFSSVGPDDSGGAMGVLWTHGLDPLVSSMLKRAGDHKLGLMRVGCCAPMHTAN